MFIGIKSRTCANWRFVTRRIYNASLSYPYNCNIIKYGNRITMKSSIQIINFKRWGVCTFGTIIIYAWFVNYVQFFKYVFNVLQKIKIKLNYSEIYVWFDLAEKHKLLILLYCDSIFEIELLKMLANEETMY